MLSSITLYYYRKTEGLRKGLTIRGCTNVSLWYLLISNIGITKSIRQSIVNPIFTLRTLNKCSVVVAVVCLLHYYKSTHNHALKFIL